MKKLLFILITAVFAVACEGPQGPEGPRGSQGPKGDGTSWFIYNFTVNEADWDYWDGDDTEDYYYPIDLTDPALELSASLREFIYEDGMTQVYLYQYDDQEQHLLPTVSHKTDGTDNWTETIKYYTSVDEIVLIVSRSDFECAGNPETMKFRIVLQW